MFRAAGEAIPGPRGRARLAAVARFRAFDPYVYRDLQRAHGDVAALGLPRTPILVFHPELARQVLRTAADRFSKGSTLAPFRALLGDGLLLSEGELWHRQRRTIAPELAERRMAAFVPRMRANTEATIDRWRQDAVASRPREVALDLLRLAFRNSAELLFGASLGDHDLGRELDAIEEMSSQGARITMRRFGAILPLPRWLPTPDNRRRRRLDARIDALVMGLVDGDEAEDAPHLLARLRRATDPQTGQPMGRRQLRDELVTLLMASFDTTGTALAWSLHLLARHPEIADRVAAEAASTAAGSENGSETGSELARQVFLEALRLYPPILGLLRTALAPVTLGGYEVAAGQNVLVSTFALHRHPEHWPDPERFDPSRFAPAVARDRHPFAYLPFGRGSRACVGEALAVLEGVVVLQRIVAAFHLRPAPGHPDPTPRHLVTLRPEGGVHLVLEERR